MLVYLNKVVSLHSLIIFGMPNDHGVPKNPKPRYILDLLLSVINVSVQTVDIVNSLPKLKFDRYQKECVQHSLC